MTAFNLDNVLAAVEGVRERYEREKNQAILKEAMGDARWAMAGEEACQRVKRDLHLWFTQNFGDATKAILIAERRGRK